MKIAVIGDPHYHGDRLFDGTDPSRNRDDCLRPWILLKQTLEALGHEVHTDDLLDPRDADLRLYNEYDAERLPNTKQGSFLVLLESPIVRREGWIKENWRHFEGVMGWAPGNDEAYHQIRIPYSAAEPDSDPFVSDRKHLCLIAGNKESREKGELYSLRRQIIRWYERHSPEEFDLFGTGWDRGYSRVTGLVRRVLDKLGFHWVKAFPSYRGPVVSKLQTLKKYRFCLAFENVEGFSGYITEKIFDPMVAGCIPVYRGSPDILDFVPAECFVDGTRFSDPQALANHLAGIGEEEVEAYRAAMRSFLEGPRFTVFSPEHFAQTVVSQMLNGKTLARGSL